MSYESGIEHSIVQNDVNSIFFSDENVAALQHGIRYDAFKKTGKIIDNQDERELRVIMRSIYLQYSRNLPTNFVKQVRQLNAKVLQAIMPKIAIEINQYETYLKDASSLPIPLDRGGNSSSAGTKFLHMNEF